MKKKLQDHLTEIQNNRKVESKRRRIRSVLSGVAVVGVLYALLLPAFTLEKTTYCGKEAHVHEDGCYEYILDCPVTGETGTALGLEEFMQLPGAAEALEAFRHGEEAAVQRAEDAGAAAIDTYGDKASSADPALSEGSGPE